MPAVSRLSVLRFIVAKELMMSGFTSNQSLRSRGVPTRLRRRVLARDHGRCQMRGPDCSGVATVVDHIQPVAEGGTDDLENLQSACDPCHDPKTQTEAKRAREKLGRKRPPPRRPGLGGWL